MNDSARSGSTAVPDQPDDDAVNQIVSRGPGGAFAVAGIATAIVVGLYLAFYFFAYLPRGVIQ